MFYMKNPKIFAPAAGKITQWLTKVGGSPKWNIFTFQNQGSGSLKWVAHLSGAPLYPCQPLMTADTADVSRQRRSFWSDG